jgi:hypothetical protein
MRGLWSTLALTVVLAGLGAYIYFQLWNKTEDTGSKQEKVFASLDAGKINELKVKSESGDVTTLKKDDGWKVVQPITAKASDSDAAGIPAALSTLEMTRVIDEKATDLKQYGLDTPRVEVDYKLDDGKSSGRLAIGQKAATGSSLYATRDDSGRVFLIPSYQESAFNKSTFDLRDKVLLSFQRDKVDAVTVDADGKTIQLSKQANGNWNLAKPIADRADDIAVDTMLGRVDAAQMKMVASEDATPADLKKFGFDKPQASVTLGLGSARATLVIGGAADDNSVYARDTSKPLVATIDKGLVDEFKKSVDDYRRKDVFEFRPFNLTRIEFVRMGQTVAFERVKGEKDQLDKWKRVSPNPADMDTTKVETMLGAFADLRVSSFSDSTAKTGVDSPVLSVDAKFDDGKKEEKIRFGQVGSDTFVVRPGDAGAPKLDTDKLTAATKLLDDLSK